MFDYLDFNYLIGSGLIINSFGMIYYGFKYLNLKNDFRQLESKYLNLENTNQSLSKFLPTRRQLIDQSVETSFISDSDSDVELTPTISRIKYLELNTDFDLLDKKFRALKDEYLLLSNRGNRELIDRSVETSLSNTVKTDKGVETSPNTITIDNGDGFFVDSDVSTSSPIHFDEYTDKNTQTACLGVDKNIQTSSTLALKDKETFLGRELFKFLSLDDFSDLKKLTKSQREIYFFLNLLGDTEVGRQVNLEDYLLSIKNVTTFSSVQQNSQEFSSHFTDNSANNFSDLENGFFKKNWN